ncbi:glutathione S-transferase family protein [Bowmanella dokdonensis]|uniref:Glutathione S-transferase n=1 Tax=Bowmanella dokdonensis TaxID=751969 RepID=A0A939DP43_9ALTE|nr:glutathione S-transferase family protein [Bowmanella dokdonensis]MBN7825685.1 glutathione S-transferase [Bowmanella dokdonensis]
MKLLYQTHSPFARKVLVFAYEVGIHQELEVVHQETSPTQRNERVFAQNPLGKVPVLIRDRQGPIFDSDVICAYFDTLHLGRRLIPEVAETRWLALRMQAVAQGLAETAIGLRWETVRRPSQYRYRPLIKGQTEKLISTYAWLEQELDRAGPVHIGHIALATTLSWIEFRELPSFRSISPGLSTWLDEFCRRPSMLATPLSGDTQD